MVAVLAVSYLSTSALIERRVALTEVQEDYQTTWCATFGDELFGFEVFDQWGEFASEHWEYLKNQRRLTYLDEYGKPTIWVDRFATVEKQYWVGTPVSDFRDYWKDYAGPFFYDTHRLLALGEDEYGNPAPLPCG